jgi:tetratricopeptide (TPR) repeat protein
MTTVGDLISLAVQALLGILLLSIIALVASASFRSRRALQFEPWAVFASGRSTEEKDALGHRVADLLLAEIREIQRVHQRSKRGLDLDNPYYDIPAFQQDLDDDLRLLASVSTQNHGPVGELIPVLLALVPVTPARLRGSVHVANGKATLTASIEGGQQRTGNIRQFRHGGDVGPDDDLTSIIRALAYEVYLDLATSSVFTDPEAFREYTEGVRQHLAFGEREDKTAVPDQAVDCYKAALAREPSNPAVLYNLGVLHYYRYRQDDNDRAITCFLRALRYADGPLKAQIHSGLCNALVQRYHRFGGSPDGLPEAQSHAEHAIAIDRDLDVALKALAFAHHQCSEVLVSASKAARSSAMRRHIRRHRSRAIHLYRRTLRVNPLYYVAANNLGNLYLEWAKRDCRRRRQKRALLQLAVQMATRSVEIKPSYEHAHDNVGNASRALGELGERHCFENARRAYEEALELKPDYLVAAHDLALLHLCADWPNRRYNDAVSLHLDALSKGSRAERARFLQEWKEAIEGHPPDHPDAEGVTLAEAVARRADAVAAPVNAGTLRATHAPVP